MTKLDIAKTFLIKDLTFWFTSTKKTFFLLLLYVVRPKMFV